VRGRRSRCPLNPDRLPPIRRDAPTSRPLEPRGLLGARLVAPSRVPPYLRPVDTGHAGECPGANFPGDALQLDARGTDPPFGHEVPVAQALPIAQPGPVDFRNNYVAAFFL
jgi:hypothetical protein